MSRELLQIPCSGGVDEKTSGYYLQPGGKQKQVVNGRWVKRGTVEKRAGYAPLTKTYQYFNSWVPFTQTLGAGTKLLARNNETLLCDGPFLYSWSPDAQKWMRRNHVPTCVARRDSVAQTTSSLVSPDIAEANGYRVVAWLGDVANNTGNVYVSVYDTTSGSYVYASHPLQTGGSYLNVSVIAVGARALVFFDDGTAGANLYMYWLDLTNVSGGWSARKLITSGRRASSTCWDAVPVIGSTTDFIVAWDTSAASNSLTVARWAWSGSTFSQSTSASVTEVLSPVGQVSLRATSGESLWLTYRVFDSGANRDYIKFAAYNPSSLAQTLAPTVASGQAGGNQTFPGIERWDATHAIVAWSGHGGSSLSWVRVTIAGALDSSIRDQFQASPLSQPFKVGSDTTGRCYMLAQSADGSNGTVAVIDLFGDDTTATMQAQEVARCAPRFAKPATGFRYSRVTNVGNVSATKFVAVSAISQTSSPSPRQGVVAITLDFAHPALMLGAMLGPNLYLSGGVPSVYDGTLATEVGFSRTFPTPSAPTTSTTGGNIGGGAGAKYQYCFVYEWTSASGDRVQSAPSVPVSVDLTASATNTNSVTFSLPQLGLTAKQQGDLYNAAVAIVPYRTTAGGTVFYRVVSDNVPVALRNSTNVANQSWTDTAADLSIATNPLLYTSGGVVENDGPPSFSAVCQHKGRIFGVGDDGRTIWFSTQYVPGQFVRFVDTFQLTLPEDITALASMDDKLIAFSAKGIYPILGDGPPDTGAGSDFVVMPRLPTDVGCIEPRSVALAPQGIVFQGQLGIYLLDRSLQVSWIGSNVTDTLTANPVITSAVVVPEENHLRWTAQAANGASGVVIVWDYELNEWCTWKIYDTDTGNTSSPFASAAYANGIYTTLTAGGMAAQERQAGDASLCLDGSQWVTLSWGSAEMHMAGLQGFKRVRKMQVLGESQSPHGLSMRIAQDGVASTQFATWLSTDMPPQGLEQLQLRLTSGRMSTLSVTISDYAPASGPVGTGQGPRLDALLIEWTPKVGPARLAAGARK